MRDVSAKMPLAGFSRPKGLVLTTIDAWTGGKPGSWTRDRIKEWFIDGTQPGAKHAVDPDGLLYTRACGGWRVDPVKAELGPKAWDVDVANWLTRARRGVGVIGRYDSRTAYFWGERSWGGRLLGECTKPKPKPPEPDPGHGKPPKPPHGGDPSPTPPPLPSP